MPSFAPQRRAAAAVLLGLAVVTCTRDLDAPRISARLDLAPHFATGSTPPGNALAVDQVRAQVVRHSTAEVVVDKTYPFASGTSLQLSISFSLTQPTDTFDVFLNYERGSETLFSGSQSVVVTGGATPAPVPLPVGYVGPGKGATSMTIGPRDTVLTSGDPLQLRLTVFDTATPDSLYVGWGTNSGSVTVDATGHLVASITRGTVTVRAISPAPPGLRDSTTVRIVPKPAAMVKVSGDGQTGVASQPLPLPLVVQVNGSDNLGVPGVTVTFAALSGGAVDSAQVVTDSLGRASTGVTLGPSTAAQSFSATTGALSVTFGATGSAAPPKTWTGAVSSDWNTAGNWNPSGVPAASDSVIVPVTANSPTLHQGGYSVRGISIQPGVTVTLDSAAVTVSGNFFDAGNLSDPTASSAIVLINGPGGTISGDLNVSLVTVQGARGLAGNVHAQTVQVLGNLLLNGHALFTTQAFTTGATGSVGMTSVGDTLSSQGAMVFGGSSGNPLTGGVVIVGGDFTVSSPGAYQPSGITTVFNGVAVQHVSVVDSGATSTLGNVDFNNTGGGVSLLSLVNASNVTIESKAIVSSPDTTFTGQGMNVVGNVTTVGGSLLHIGRLYIGGAFGVGGTYLVESTILTGSGQAVPASLTYPFLYVTGIVTLGAGPYTITNQLAVQGGSLYLGGNLNVPGNVFSQFGGSLVPNGHTLTIGGALTLNQSGLLRMSSANDSVIVGGNAFFGGADESPWLSLGTIIFQGNFTEAGGDPQAFAPSGSHVDEFLSGGGSQIISFAHPGATGASHFQGLAISNGQGTLQIASDVYLLGGYSYVAGSPKIVHGGGQVVHYANLTITGVTFDNVAIAYDAALGGNNLIALDSVTFENYNVNSATPLIAISSPGNTGSPGAPFVFSNLSFLTNITSNAGSGHYLGVTNTGAAGALILNVSANLPAGEGLAHTVQVGSPTVTWP